MRPIFLYCASGHFCENNTYCKFGKNLQKSEPKPMSKRKIHLLILFLSTDIFGLGFPNKNIAVFNAQFEIIAKII